MTRFRKSSASLRSDREDIKKQSVHDINTLLMTQRLRNIRLSAKLEGIYRKDIYELPPGGFMPGVTLDKMKEGYLKIRNRALAHAFSYMNLIEKWGSGIPKLMEAM